MQVSEFEDAETVHLKKHLAPQITVDQASDTTLLLKCFSLWMDSLMQITRREGALAGAIHVGSLTRRRGREEHQGSFILLPCQGSHAHTNTYKHFSSPPMQPARLSLSEDRGWHLSRSWLTSYNLPVSTRLLSWSLRVLGNGGKASARMTPSKQPGGDKGILLFNRSFRLLYFRCCCRRCSFSSPREVWTNHKW